MANGLVMYPKDLLWYILDTMEDKITIIEGPPPVFEAVSDGWALSLTRVPAYRFRL